MEVTLTKKSLDIIALAQRPTTRLITLEGTVRSSKTVTALQAFFYKVYSSKDQLHCLAGNSLDSIRDNLLTSPFGLITLFPKFCKLAREKVGGWYLAIQGEHGLRKVLLAGYSDFSRWKKILGKTIATFLIDEVNTADETFIRETFMRQLSCDEPLQIWTLNGDEPNHYIYTEFINRSRIYGTIPASIRADMEKQAANPSRIYSHWTFKDNPAMTSEKIEEANKWFPPGSYYHTIKILGERGTPGALIYNEYMSDALMVDINAVDAQGRRRYNFVRYTLGVDIGASRAYNVFALIGWCKDCSIAVVLDVFCFKQMGYDRKTELLQDFINRHNTTPIEAIYVDSAEQNYTYDLRGKIHTTEVASWNKEPIKRRIDMGIIGFARRRLLFDLGCREAYQAFYSARWAEGKLGQEREDKNEKRNDIMDAIEYGLQPYMNAFLAHREVNYEEPTPCSNAIIERKEID